MHTGDMTRSKAKVLDKRILVLQGGRGNEREVSLRSAGQVAGALQSLGHSVFFGDPAEADFDLDKLTQSSDVVIMIHGVDGEDGVFQRQLEAMEQPFLGSGSAACELTYDKSRYRKFMATQDVGMAHGEVVSRQAFDQSKLRQVPYVLKPIKGGSSVDTVIVHDLANEPKSAYFDSLFAKYGQMLLEQLIEGQEITVGILGSQALPVILIVPPQNGEFDYENKYNGQSQEIVDPPQIDGTVKRGAQELALRIHGLTGCRHLSRTDMIVTPEGELYVLETNTMPGMTAESLFPKAAATAGHNMPALVRCFLEMANGV